MKDNLERDVEDRFFDMITNQKSNPTNSNYKIYQKLVFYRYEEVVKTTFPQFCKMLDESELESLIYKFLETPCKTEFVWQIANDFRKFVKKQKLFDDRKYLYEILYFDWIELELFMKQYDLSKIKKFDYKRKYSLSNSSIIKKFKYNIINSDFESKRENYVLIYYDFELNEVIFREINEFLFYFVKSIENKSLNKNLKNFCKANEINFKEAKEQLSLVFEELVQKRVLAFK